MITIRGAIPVGWRAQDGKDGAPGQGAVYIDLDNENDTLLYDGQGNLIGGAATSNIRLYDNGVDVTAQVTFIVDSMNNVSASVSGSVITVSGMSAASGWVRVRCTYKTAVYYARMTLKRLVDTDKYEIGCTPSAITYNETTGAGANTTVEVRVYHTNSIYKRYNESSLNADQYLRVVRPDGSTYSLSYGNKVATFTPASSWTTCRVELIRVIDGVERLLDSETIPILHTANGQKGDKGNRGNDGNSVDAMFYEYALSTMSRDVTNQTVLSWGDKFLTPTEELPYLWRRTVTVYTLADDYYSDPELILSYQPGANSNLIQDAGFDSIYGMEAWDIKSWYAVDTNKHKGSAVQLIGSLYYAGGTEGVYLVTNGTAVRVSYSNGTRQTSSVTVTPGDSYYIGSTLYIATGSSWQTECDTADGLANGTQGRNSYYSSMKMTNSATGYKEILRQIIHKPGEDERLEGGRWYTLSFYAKGYGNMWTYLFPWDVISDHGCIDTSVPGFVDGVQKSLGGDGFREWQLTGEWKRHTYTFKTKSTIYSGTNQVLLVRHPAISTTGWKAYICMPKLEVGMVATQFIDNAKSGIGAIPRNGEWTLGRQYLQGAVGERFLDIVMYDKKHYECLKSHVATNDNKPVDGRTTEYWRPANEWMFIASKLALIEKIKAELIDTDTLITRQLVTSDVGQRIDIRGNTLKAYGNNDGNYMQFGFDEQGNATLAYYQGGRKIYDLGPDGIKGIDKVQSSWETVKWYYMGDSEPTANDLWDLKEGSGYNQYGSRYVTTTAYYLYHGAFTTVDGGTTKKFNNSTEEAYDNHYFTQQSLNPKFYLANGYYIAHPGVYMSKIDPATDEVVMLTCRVIQIENGAIKRVYKVSWDPDNPIKPLPLD